MAQAKRKTATRTKKQTGARKAKSTASRKTCAKKSMLNNTDRMHIYIVTAMSMVTLILLCADIAMMIV